MSAKAAVLLGAETERAPKDRAHQKRSLVERGLGLFSDVRAGEGAAALVLTLNLFVLLTTYYALKVVREPLILLGGMFGIKGATLKAAATAAQAVLLLAVVPAYGWLASRVDRMKLITTVTILFVLCLVAFNVLANLQVPIGFVFFAWLGIFSLMIIGQFWSLMNDLYDEASGKRLFPIVAFGGTSGAVAGAWLGGALSLSIGHFQVMLVAAGLLLFSLILTYAAQWIDRTRNGDRNAQIQDQAMTKKGGFRLVLGKRYLLLVGLMVLIYNAVNTNGEFILAQIVTHEAAERAALELGPLADPHALKEAAGRFIGKTYAEYFTYVNLLTALLQLFLVSRILKWAGVRAALFFLPVIALASNSLILIVPMLMAVRIGKTLENGTDYSIQNTTRQALFLPTSRDEKYKAKAAIDTFFVRFGDLLSFAIVFLVSSSVESSSRGVAAINLVLIATWIAIAAGIVRHHRRLSPADART
jgi:ATP:ADP antiporter, AAA family